MAIKRTYLVLSLHALKLQGPINLEITLVDSAVETEIVVYAPLNVLRKVLHIRDGDTETITVPQGQTRAEQGPFRVVLTLPKGCSLSCSSLTSIAINQ